MTFGAALLVAAWLPQATPPPGPSVPATFYARNTTRVESWRFTVNRHWSVNAYAARIHGGDVVRNLFTSDVLTFVYLESVIQFQPSGI